MKLNPPLYKLCRSEGMAISNPHFYNKWQGWALAQNPLAYWNFNSTAGPFPDLTGRSSGVVPGSAMTLGVSGYVDGSLAMTGLESLGSSGLATVTYTGALSGQYQKMTFEFLVKFNDFKATPVGAAARRGYFLWGGNISTGFKMGTDLAIYANIGIFLDGAPQSSASFGIGMDNSDLTKWYHFVVTCDGLTPSYVAYINGIPIALIFPTGEADYISLGTSNLGVCGYPPVGGTACPHSMDELIIYDKCLTEEEVSMRFAQTGLTNGYVPVE